MAQPAVDLPDPMNGGNLAGVANADDLLSQLAGDEIDRLLAESDGDAPPPPVAPAPTHTPIAAPAAPVSSTAITAQPAPVGTGAVAAAPVSAVSVTEASLDEILAETAPASADEDEERSHAARRDPEPTAAPSKPVALAEAVALRLDLAPRAPRVGLLVKPLLWLNAPVANLSEPARELLGKIALVTLINALAVLAYVLIFVRHRH